MRRALLVAIATSRVGLVAIDIVVKCRLTHFYLLAELPSIDRILVISAADSLCARIVKCFGKYAFRFKDCMERFRLFC